MTKNSKLLFLISLILMALFLAACTENDAEGETDTDTDTDTVDEDAEGGGGTVEGDQVTIRYGHFQPGDLSQPKHSAAEAFKSYVEANSNGSVEVEIYPAGQLGDEATTLEGLQLDSIQMTVIHDGPIASIYEPMGVFNMPYLFNNQGEAWTAFDSEYTEELGEAMRTEVGIRLLGMADNGIRHFTNDEGVIRSPDDMDGMVMRVQPGELYERFINAIGASPSAVPWPELPAALQQGVVDGQENGVTNILAASLFESQEHVTLDGHIYSYHAYLISDDFWDGLSSDQQTIIQEGVDIAKWIHRGMTANQDMNASRILSEQGMEVTSLTDEEVEVFRETTQPVIAEWMREQVGEEWVDPLLELVESIR